MSRGADGIQHGSGVLLEVIGGELIIGFGGHPWKKGDDWRGATRALEADARAIFERENRPDGGRYSVQRGHFSFGTQIDADEDDVHMVQEKQLGWQTRMTRVEL